MSNTTRPHRRLSLTLPSTNPTATEASTSQTTPTSESTAEAVVEESAESETVRVMAYLTSEESQVLDELWLLMRRKHGKVSKSDILRASLMMAFADQNSLSDTMSKQQVNTSSRQRSSKIVRK